MSTFTQFLLAETQTETPVADPLMQFWQDVKSFFTNAGLNLVIGIAIIVLGLIFCKIFKVVLKKIMKKAKRDDAIVHFVTSLVDVILKIVVLIAALATMGINTASIITVLGTCGVAIGLALKDSLGNLASGVIIAINKPFKTGDYIQAAGEEGTVETINLFNTTLVTPDNKEIVVPNGALSSSNIVNFSTKETRRVDFEFIIAHDADFNKAQNTILSVLGAHSLVLADPEPVCRLKQMQTNGVLLTARAWVKNSDYWTVYFDVMEQMRDEFAQRNIAVPANQVDVRVLEKANNPEMRDCLDK